MDKYQIRTFLEHHLLPRLFYEQRIVLLTALLSKKGDVLTKYYQMAGKAIGETIPCSKDDFQVFSAELDGGYQVVEIVPPLPTYPPECYRILLCFKLEEKDISNLHYFTIEKAKQAMNEEIESAEFTAVLGEWTEYYTHNSYDTLTSEETVKSRIEEILWKKEMAKTGDVWVSKW